jgi:hypothetical protein
MRAVIGRYLSGVHAQALLRLIVIRDTVGKDFYFSWAME